MKKKSWSYDNKIIIRRKKSWTFPPQGVTYGHIGLLSQQDDSDIWFGTTLIF